MKKLMLHVALALPSALLIVACDGKKPEGSGSAIVSNAVSSAKIICSYAPSQSKVVEYISEAAQGATFTAEAVANAAGLTAVRHSSGAYIFTGAGGYLSGTIGAAGALPVIAKIGVVVGTVGGTLELVCVSENHAELVEKVQAAAVEVVTRTKYSVGNASTRSAATVQPVFAEVKNVAVKSTGEAFAYANRASVQVSEAMTNMRK